MKTKPYLLQNEAFDVILDYFKNNSNSCSMSDDLCLALKKLEEIKQNNQSLTWKQLGIIASVESYLANSEGKPLTRQSFLENHSLPSADVFKNSFGKTSFKWLLERYPCHTKKSSTDLIYGGKAYDDVDEVKDAFIKEYYRIRPATQHEFNSKKSKTIPYWESLAARFGVASWIALIDLLELPRYNKRGDNPLRVIETNLCITDDRVSFAGRKRPHVFRRTFWTEVLIRQRVEGFIIQNGRIPSREDLLGTPELPSPETFNNVVKMNWRLWIKETFPDCVPDNWRYDLLSSKKIDKKKWLELFKKEYKRIKPATGNQYNQQRTQGTPTWNTIAKLIGESEHKWSNMKKVAGVEDVPISSNKPST